MSQKKYFLRKSSLILNTDKGVLFTRLRDETPLHASFPAFYIVEAAVTIPVFVCFAVCLLFFFCAMQLQTDLQVALNHTGVNLAALAMMENRDSQKVNPTTELAAAELIFRKQLKKCGAQTEYIRSGVTGISLLGSEFEGDSIHLKAVYRLKMPTILFGNHVFTVRQQTKARKWIGDEAVRTETGEWVYITPTGKAYHISCGCPYLDLSIRSAKLKQVDRLRNKSGGKYAPCSMCSAQPGAAVYITDYGDVYHGSITCSGLKRSVRKVKKSEVGNRHICKKCGG